jgi:hypothetical protein
VDTDDLNRMLVEIVLKKPLTREDTAEEAAMRAQLTKECNEIVARGGVVDIPHEVPDVS